MEGAIMNQEDQIQYLANIYFLAGADDNFTVIEDVALIKIAESIGGGYLETRKALDMSMEAGFKIKLPKLEEDRLRNLEDIMLVAFVDNKLVETERDIIMSFAKKLGVSSKELIEIKNKAVEKSKEIK